VFPVSGSEKIFCNTGGQTEQEFGKRKQT